MKRKKKMNYKVVAKYIKDLRFEIPNPKIFFLLEKNIQITKLILTLKATNSKTRLLKLK